MNKKYKYTKAGGKLRKLRKDKGFKSQESFSEKIGCARESVRNWESGFCIPDDKYKDKICEVLGINEHYLSLILRPDEEEVQKKESSRMEQDLQKFYEVLKTIVPVEYDINKLQKSLIELREKIWPGC